MKSVTTNLLLKTKKSILNVFSLLSAILIRVSNYTCEESLAFYTLSIIELSYQGQEASSDFHLISVGVSSPIYIYVDNAPLAPS